MWIDLLDLSTRFAIYWKFGKKFIWNFDLKNYEYYWFMNLIFKDVKLLFTTYITGLRDWYKKLQIKVFL